MHEVLPIFTASSHPGSLKGSLAKTGRFTLRLSDSIALQAAVVLVRPHV